MIAFMALFLPAVLAAWNWMRGEGASGKQPVGNAVKGVAAYASAVLIINSLDLLVLTLLHKGEGSLVMRLNQYANFAMKYILLSVSIAIVLPAAARAVKQGLIVFKVSPSVPSMPRGVSYAMIFAYAIILFSMNFIRIFDENYWGDEAYSVNLVRNPIPTIISTTANDVHPPLYYILLRALYLLLGDHGYAYHFLSVIPLAIILVFCLVRIRKVFGTGAALFLMTMAGISGNAVTYNVEIRMYSWAAMFVLLSFYELYMVLQTNRKSSYFWFSLFSVGAAYSHYYALVAVAFFYLVPLAWSFTQGKKRMIRAFAAAICTALAYLPWLGVLLRSFARSSGSFWATSFPTFRQCVSYLFSNQFRPAALAVLALAMLWVALCGTGILDICEKDGGGAVVSFDASRLHVSPGIVWGAAGIASVAGTIAVGIGVSTIFRPLLVLRYIYPASAAAWLLAGVALSRLRIGKAKLGNVCLAVSLVYMLIIFLPAYKDKYVQEKASNETLEATLEAIGDGISDESVILTDINHMDWTIAGYYFPDAECRHIGESISEDVEDGGDYWIFLNAEVGKPLAVELALEGYDCKEVVRDGVIGTQRAFVYHLVSFANGT